MAEHVLRLPQAIWARFGLPSEVHCTGQTIREALDDVCRRLPALTAYLAPDSPSLLRSVLVFADGNRVVDIGAGNIEDGTILQIVIPSAGG